MGQLAGHALVSQQIGPNRRGIELEPIVIQRQHLEEPGARRCVGGQGHQAVVIGAESQLPGGAEHSLRRFAADLPLLDHHPAGQRGTHPRKGILPPGHDVGRAADHMAPLPGSIIHDADPEPIGVGVRAHLLHQRHDDAGELLVQRPDRVHRGAEHRQLLGQVPRVERTAQERLEPAARDVHASA